MKHSRCEYRGLHRGGGGGKSLAVLNQARKCNNFKILEASPPPREVTCTCSFSEVDFSAILICIIVMHNFSNAKQGCI